MPDPTVAELLEVAVEAATLAGRRTLDYFQAGVAVEWKPDGSPVTAADRDAERLLRRAIGRAFPDHAIVGEEGGESAGTAGYRWILDPIDGTRTFVRGVPLYGVLVAVEEADEVVAGVIALPALGEVVAAGRGLGCTWNGRPCRVSAVARLDQALVVVTDEKRVRARGPGYERLAAATAMQRTWADCYGYALVATGRAEVALDPLMALWDGAPMLPILEEAGGRFTTWRGERSVRGGDAVASNGRVHDEALRLLGAG